MRLACCFFVISLLLAVTATTGTECPDGWRYLPASDKCYKVLDEDLTFDEARAKCIDVGGTLASIESEEETDFAGEMARSASLSVVRHDLRVVSNTATFSYGIRTEGDMTWWTSLDCNSRVAALCQRQRVETLKSTSIDALATAISTLQEASQQLRSLENKIEEVRSSEKVERERLATLENEGRKRIESLEDKVNQIWWKDDDLARLTSLEAQLSAVRPAQELERERTTALESRLNEQRKAEETERVQSLEGELEAMRKKEEAGRDAIKSLQGQLKEQWKTQMVLAAFLAVAASVIVLLVDGLSRKEGDNGAQVEDGVETEEVLTGEPSFEQVDGDGNSE